MKHYIQNNLIGYCSIERWIDTKIEYYAMEHDKESGMFNLRLSIKHINKYIEFYISLIIKRINNGLQM